MVSFLIMNKIIYVDETTGMFSYSYFDNDENHYIDYEEIITSFSPTFITICLCVSNACNFNCEYCFNKKKNNKKMTFELAKKIIDKMIDIEFPYCDKYYVDVSGYGEPLLNLDCILKINKYCQEKSDLIRKEILVSFVTNGYLLTKEVVNVLQNSGIIFGISIDGDKITHNKKRKTISEQDTYDIILNNVKNIEKKEFLGCAVTLSTPTISLETIIDSLLPYFNTISIKPVRESSSPISLSTIDRWNQEYSNLARRILNDARKNNVKILKSLINGDDYFGKFLYRSILKNLTINRCDYGISRFCFTEDGKMFGCAPATSYEELRMPFVNANYYFKKQVEDTKKTCSSCPFYLFCGGECFIETKMNNSKNSSLCSLKKHLIQLSLYISLELETNFPFVFYQIYEFCKEKQKRFSINKELYEFLSLHENYSFNEGKEIFYSLK